MTIKMKRPPPQALPSPPDPRFLARETLRISADIASSSSSTTSLQDSTVVAASASVSAAPGLLNQDLLESSARFICCEEIDGRRWKYVTDYDDGGSSGSLRKGSFRAVCLQTPQSPVDEFVSFVRSYVVPEGFPDSVAPSYVPYMSWRALKHFFGGAMGVFTTQTLLNSVGVSRNQSTSGAVAINWILKDGAGRVGKMLFSRQGKKFDYDLKQLRISGDILLELGAGLELATASVPHLFLPLACVANVVKNVAAVTSTSTRTPIYKAFARGENIGDVTAKGECVGNVADLLGTGLSIMISKRNPSLVRTFALLSCGYLFSSYQEVRSVVLHTLNRARFSVAVESFLKTGRVPSLQEGNVKEELFNLPWLKERPMVLGPRFKEAFQDAGAYYSVAPFFEKERYLVTYNPSKGKVYALLKDKAKPDDILKAAFHAHVLLHFLSLASSGRLSSGKHQRNRYSKLVVPTANLEAQIADSCELVAASYGLFKSKAADQGWMMSESLLNPGHARLC
ncbi:hypothetical protein MLD38_022843 [Melastoma candidum]|uniref:Uncharacterized protein n=1 Tax=Melastoma candidum TaxID=119954 RepID=A0ACB9QMF1_9MYRT|nr:hypothetical protein MLD38_022843 [Melastoma candidum]